MAHAAGDAHEYPVYGYHFRAVFPILDNDGDLVASAAGLDSEVSKDTGTFADCTNEATQIATTAGMYYLDLTGAEMTAKVVAVKVKSTTTDSKDTTLVFFPIRLPVLETGTAQAGAATTITLAAGASAVDDFYNGLLIGITNDSPAGVDDQLRRIVDYDGTTKIATIDSAWGTNPSSATTYEILIPEGANVAAWAGKKVSDPGVDGVPEVDVIRWLAGTPNALQTGRVDSRPGALAADVITAASIAANAIGSSELAADAIGASQIASGAIDADAIAANAITAAKIAADAITAAKIAADAITAAKIASDAVAEIADGVWDEDIVAAHGTADTAGLLLSLLLGRALPTGWSTDVQAGSAIDQMADDGTAVYDRTTDSLQAIRDRGDAAWTTGGGGSITDILNVIPLMPKSIDLANTATVRLGLMLTNAVDDLPSLAEITPGTISIHRKAIGGTTWSAVVTDAACSELAGLVYYDEVFDSGSGYAEGDTIRVTFKSQKITVSANDYEVTDANGRFFYTEIRQTMRGTDAAALATVATESRLSELDGANLPTDIANVKTDTAAILIDTADMQPKLGMPAGASISADIAAVSGKIAQGIPKNTALAGFTFVMIDETDDVTPITGRTVTATRSIDGSAFGACANAVAEVANGVYKIDLAAADLNGDTVMLRFTATGANDTLIGIVTE